MTRMALLPLETTLESAADGGLYGSTSGGATTHKTKDSAVTHRSNATTQSATAMEEATTMLSSSSSSSASPTTRPRACSNSKEFAATLLERYHQATSTKMYDVEELVDYYFHRRLAAFTAVVISYLPFVITPNQITVFGLFLGWGAATCLYDSEFHEPLGWDPKESLFAAGMLMFLWIVSDCADGQVARLCKRGTRTGRILDGCVDGLVIAPNCYILGLLCSNRYGENYMPLCWFAGLSLWIHALVYDKIKNVYMENALPQSECDGETVESVTKEYQEAKAKDPYSLDTILLGVYVVYLTVQGAATSDAATKAEATRYVMLAKCNDHYRAGYINKYSYVVRVASFMGISAHVVGFYVAYFVAIYYWDALYYVQLYFGVVLNAVFATVLVLYFKSGMASQQPLNTAM
ncbi:hypothetical protein Poli38472_002141 [Pythium oligandrum]|uniref:CDP-alcohol phosphatidyltransferase n=1 Tax=Pythium oligandrum TaxID=41045 RepID=A0A8K1CI82_PYTOL|nr:hypothetical protein Poli38472_002141 [Pythium oligandrum]|eukprot:TMW63200.1 hypothetical protein Poli38472_002141 [Pythium oligandrum]